jgi:hypothetical protein
MRKIGASDFDGVVLAMAVEREGHVSGAAAEVQQLCVRATQHSGKRPGGSIPPQAVDVHRENVVQKVVAGSD